jgi:hypothetical protein
LKQITPHHEYLIKPFKAFIRIVRFYIQNAVNTTFFTYELNVLSLLSQGIVRGLPNESAKEQRKEEVQKKKELS